MYRHIFDSVAAFSFRCPVEKACEGEQDQRLNPPCRNSKGGTHKGQQNLPGLLLLILLILVSFASILVLSRVT